MFDVGFWELALISAVALLIIGPERLPAAAHTAGLWVGKARRMLRDVKADIDRELREHRVKEVDELKKDIEDAGGEFKHATAAATDDLKETFKQASPVDDDDDKPVDAVKKKTAKKKSKQKTAKKKTAKKKVAKKKTVKRNKPTEVKK